MKKIQTILVSMSMMMFTAGCVSAEKKPAGKDTLDLSKAIKAIDPAKNILARDNWHVWGGSVVKHTDGKYYMFYARWPMGMVGRDMNDPKEKIFNGMRGWMKYSEIAIAVSDNPDGPFKYLKTILKSTNDKNLWNCYNAHNPHIKKFNGKYYLYYIATRPIDKGDHWMKFCGGQRIGVIEADSIEDFLSGNFKLPAEPIMKPDEVKIFHRTVNPSVTQTPDGTYLMMFKSSSHPSGRGHMVHWVASAPKPTGPFKVLGTVLKSREYSAEDPYFWYDKSRNRYYAIVKDFSNSGKLSPQFGALALITSDDGIHNWRPAEHKLVSLRKVKLADGSSKPLANLERPQLLLDDEGRPVCLYAAAAYKNPFAGNPSYNFHFLLTDQPAEKDDQKSKSPAKDK